MIIGTHYFVSHSAAIAYYRDYGCTPADVCRKLVDGEIAVGLPPAKLGETPVKIDGGRRWALRTNGEGA